MINNVDLKLTKQILYTDKEEFKPLINEKKDMPVFTGVLKYLIPEVKVLKKQTTYPEKPLH